MKDIKINLGRPYNRDNETALIIKLEFECTFTDQSEALKFHEKLNKLILDNIGV